ncbi:hypothetical protein [Brasilonema sp. UFV-L1]|nr:hypothetical protein [Brasilonema sp. UFV-L1]
MSQDGDALEIEYRHTLENLGKDKGLLGDRFACLTLQSASA